jgi:DNA-binding transcriptional ArsR family regulator
MVDRVLQAISDPVRRQILDLLRTGQFSAGEIASRFTYISRPAVSQHLAVLREANLVEVQKEGRKQLYSLNPSPLRVLWEDWLVKYETLWTNKLLDLKRIVEDEKKTRETE